MTAPTVASRSGKSSGGPPGQLGSEIFASMTFRHHGATMALNRGFTAPIVMALGGWKTERMMRRYAAVTDRTLRAAAEAVSGSEGVRSRDMAPVSPAELSHGK